MILSKTMNFSIHGCTVSQRQILEKCVKHVNLPYFSSNLVNYFSICISDLAVFGFCIVENLPSNLESLPQLIKTIAFEKRTHYGTYFVVKSRSEQISNLAYTSAPLGLHLDLPYYDFVPGVNYFIHL